MERSEFDKFADEYHSLHEANIAISGEGPEYFAEYKIKDIATEYFARVGPGHRAPAVLDFGAGIGNSVPFVQRHLPGARLTCLDVSAKSLALGRERFAGQAEFTAFDGIRIPCADASYDLAYAACVFHHIDHDEHVRLLKEFHRALTADGVAFVFEHNPLNPLTVRVVNTCPFDENARLIGARAMRSRLLAAGFSDARVKYRIFFPNALRALRPAEKWLTWLPLGAQYYVMATK
jgi:SAM-dependent methyltransferase